jgi:hypothetical protein
MLVIAAIKLIISSAEFLMQKNNNTYDV